MSNFKIVRDLKFRIDLTQKTASLISNENLTATKILIPDNVDGCIVKEIAANVFDNNEYIEEVNIPDTVNKIHFCAFRHSSNLKIVNIYATKYPMCPLWIDMLAFADCHNLQEFNAYSCKYMSCANSAFLNCVSLSTLDVKLFVVENKVFHKCSKIEHLTFVNGCRWKLSAFQGCSGIKSIYFDGTVNMTLSQSDLRWLKGKNIRCPANSEIAEFAYLGFKIDVF